MEGEGDGEWVCGEGVSLSSGSFVLVQKEGAVEKRVPYPAATWNISVTNLTSPHVCRFNLAKF